MLKWLGGIVDSNDKEVKKLEPFVKEVNALEDEFKNLSDDELRAKTGEFKAAVAAKLAELDPQIVEIKDRMASANSPEERNKLKDKLIVLDNRVFEDVMAPAFAAVREASRRSIGLRHYDVQLMGGAVLHQGKISEMKTGEGKTLVATLPLYLNSLAGTGVHLVTQNDYLARRDAYWMGPLYHALGVTVAAIYPMQSPDENTPARLYDPSYISGKENDPWQHYKKISRKEAYQADITYGTSAEFGFDYLRDNMVFDLSQQVQRGHSFAVVDEVDNLLIDEARTPLIISAPDTESGKLYQNFARLVLKLNKTEDYETKEKERSAEPTEAGWAKVETLLKHDGVLKSESLYDPQNAHLMRHLRNALSAKEFYLRDHQYVVNNGEIIIVDEFTGRLMLGRRYSEGLHQAIEAKEGVKVQDETKTYASITIQNYFRMYDKLGGMTGTALTEAEELSRIYKLEVVVIPTNKPMIREDFTDQIYKDLDAKFKAVANEITTMSQAGRPVLVGTVSIQNSEILSDLLKRRGVKHAILNAKKHELEANIVAEAGEPGSVTVATNMAGRGVDIILGGLEPDKADTAAHDQWQARHAKVVELGGLHVIGTERHEARRIDNQLRGRAGRQGDPGSSRFYVSLDDDIVRRFGGERVKSIMEWAGMDENTPIENSLISKSIENAQKRVEGFNFDIRKNLVEYDDVINKHREIIYGERRKILEGANLKQNILDMVNETVDDITASRLSGLDAMDWDVPGLLADINAIMPLGKDWSPEFLSKHSTDEIADILKTGAKNLYDTREHDMGELNMRLWERFLMLKVIDTLWVDHLTMVENMRVDAQMQTLRQIRAVDAYKNQGFEAFEDLLAGIRHDVVHAVFHGGIMKQPPQGQTAAPATAKAVQAPVIVAQAPDLSEASPMAKVQTPAAVKTAPHNEHGEKVGRNDPCPCGSGKKYKKCCGAQ